MQEIDCTVRNKLEISKLVYSIWYIAKRRKEKDAS